MSLSDVKSGPELSPDSLLSDPESVMAAVAPLTARHLQLMVSADEAGLRLDQFLAARVPGLSRTLARKLIDLGGVHCAGRRLRQCSRCVVEAETYTLHIDGLPLETYRVMADDILLNDGFLLALNKRAGVETQPTPARYQGTLYAALLEYLRDPTRRHVEPTLGMVQRLDRDTSGVILFSIHQRAHRGLTTAFSGRQVRKLYQALVCGVPAPAAGELRSELARCRDNRVRSVARGGREAVTRYRVLRILPGAALLEVEILTGRSHQIRAHLSEAGHPLLGDTRYGGPSVWQDESVARQMLHSWRLELQHPVTGSPLVIEAPPPPDMERLLRLAERVAVSNPSDPAGCNRGEED